MDSMVSRGSHDDAIAISLSDAPHDDEDATLISSNSIYDDSQVTDSLVTDKARHRVTGSGRQLTPISSAELSSSEFAQASSVSEYKEDGDTNTSQDDVNSFPSSDEKLIQYEESRSTGCDVIVV